MLIKGLYFIYQCIVIVPIGLVLTILTALVTIVGCFFGSADFWGYYPARLWSRAICALSLISVKVKGREHLDASQSYVFVANHQGAFDIFLIYGYLNRSFKWIMKASLRKVPFVGKACESCGHIFIDDSGVTGVRSSMQQAHQVLSNGASIVIFPEGARTLTGKMRPFKKGAFQLAVELGLSVVPMTIEGPFHVLKRGTRLLSPHPLHLTIHAPIEVHPKEGIREVVRLKNESYQVIKDSLVEFESRLDMGSVKVI